MEPTWKIYKVPFYYDEADEAMTFKYVNDMPNISCNVLENHAPNYFIAAIKATAEQHAELAAHDDVEVVN